MATAIQRGKSKKWYAVYKLADGKWKWLKGYKDKKETFALAQRLEDEQRKIKLGDIDPQADARRVERSKPIATHIEQYKANLQASGRDANHVAYTVADINRFVDHAGVSSASEITRPQMDTFVRDLQTAGKDANRTINRRVGSVQAFLRHLSDPCVGGVNQYVLRGFKKLPIGAGHQKRISRAFDRRRSYEAHRQNDRSGPQVAL